MKPINRVSVVSTGTVKVRQQACRDERHPGGDQGNVPRGMATFTYAHDPAAESLLATALRQHETALT